MIDIEEKYKNRYFINGVNMFDAYGVIIEDGGYAELLKEPQRKTSYTFDWPDNDGTDRYISRNFNTRTVTLKLIFIADTLQEYFEKKEAIYGILKNIEHFTLSVTTLRKEWDLLYNDTTSVEYLTDVHKGEKVIARHTITLFDDITFGLNFEPIALLTDENGDFLTDNENNLLTLEL